MSIYFYNVYIAVYIALTRNTLSYIFYTI